MLYTTTGFTGAEKNFIDKVLNDPKSWGVQFRAVASHAKHDVVAHKMPQGDIDKIFHNQPHLHGLSVCDRREKPIQIYISAENWAKPPLQSGYKDSRLYRTYLILHEFGHALGHDHALCPGEGHPAPVMMQQTKGTGLCFPEPWVVKQK
jgi:hypothetical protein